MLRLSSDDPKEFADELRKLDNVTYKTFIDTCIVLKMPTRFYDGDTYDFNYNMLSDFLRQKIIEGDSTKEYDQIRNVINAHLNNMDKIIKKTGITISYHISLELDKQRNYWKDSIRNHHEQLEDRQKNTQLGYYHGHSVKFERKEKPNVKLEKRIQQLSDNIAHDISLRLETIKKTAAEDITIFEYTKGNPDTYSSFVDLFSKANTKINTGKSESYDPIIIAEAATYAATHNMPVRIVTRDRDFLNIIHQASKTPLANMSNINDFVLELFFMNGNSDKRLTFDHRLTLLALDHKLTLEY